jgi:hypothetical protein
MGALAFMPPLSHASPRLMRFSAAGLTVNEPGDRYEQEAGRVADQVMRMPVAEAVSCDCASSGEQKLQRKCASCEEEEENNLQRKETAPGPATAPPIVNQVLNSPGRPLDAGTRAFMETRFGHDFSRVRVHADAGAAESARAVDALAYTVRQDVVFAAGQYDPATRRGRQLLAHELSHVVQQAGAPRAARKPAAETQASPELTPASPMVQLTPAPPAHHGVTGVRDLSRVRIDAVADFVASRMTAARNINAHISDASVTHVSWELYDPRDQLLPESFSTLPGHPTSTTSPFPLAPSTFSGSGFTPGLYLLRCVGRNAAHEPVVYADRDFNVVTSDLTTSTPLATAHGKLTFTDYAPTNATRTTGHAVDVELRFLPDASVRCADVVFMQALQATDSQGKNQQGIINSEQDARTTPLAWSIDRVEGAPSPVYIMGRDPDTGAVADDPSWGQAGGGGRTPSEATLSDRPGGSMAVTRSRKFESCVLCRSGADKGQVYGCATWGYTTTAAGVVSLMPRSFRSTPSDQFEEARVAWNTWRGTQPAATRPDEAPALRAP